MNSAHDGTQENPSEPQYVEILSEGDVIEGRNMNSLRSWRPGQSGNPAGKKKGTLNFKTILTRMLEEPTAVTINDKTYRMTRAQAIVYQLMQIATNGENDAVKLRAIMELIDRIDGKAGAAMQEPPSGHGDTVIFYIPNKHSRFRQEGEVHESE